MIETNKDQSGGSEKLFVNLIWLTTKEAALFLRTSVGALHNAVYSGQIRARKFRRRLYFNKNELIRLIETSDLKGVSYGNY